MTTVAAAVFLAQVAGGSVGQAGVYLASVFALGLGISARSEGLGALAILHLPIVGFGAIRGTASRPNTPSLVVAVFGRTVGFVSLLGVQIAVPLVASSAALIRVALSLIAVRISGRRSPPPALVAIWLLAFLPAILGALDGRQEGHNGWSKGVRALLAYGGVFWGMLMSQRHSLDVTSDTLARRIRYYTSWGAAMGLVGGLRGHLRFLVAGLSGSFCIFSWMDRSRAAAAVFSAYCIQFLITGTLTQRAIVLVSGALALYAVVANSSRGRIWGRLVLALAGLILSLLFVLSMTYADEIERSEFGGRITTKLQADRAPLWRAAAEVVLQPPYLVVPAGRPLHVADGKYAWTSEWENGAHNAVLETFYQAGFLAGSVCMLLALMSMFSGIRVLRDDSCTLGSRHLAAAAIGTIVPGMITGNFPMSEMVGFLIWTLAGMVWAFDRQKRG